MRSRYSRILTASASLTGLLLTAGCGFDLDPESRCTSTSISTSIREKYSLPELPKADDIRFCEGSDKDGDWARLTFRSSPADTHNYLESLDMKPQGFVSMDDSDVNRLTNPEREGWALTKGLPYKVNGKAREHNGHCLVDYKAFIQDSADWDGRVYMGMYCSV
ncbi:hypothetical protein [Streptomyces erythrochromogenes]|uniref:hypothetical protein n=1 Tax=Streptomyces erythrochromogenes TaxID=285574 RepID=UPI003866411D|nr:hypothetical protein OG364_25440 [Streptomyces erythrochromogenes]